MCSTDCFLAFIAILFPPIAVWVKRGICSIDSIINFALLCLGYLPGLLHAWYIIAKYPDECYVDIDETESHRPPHARYYSRVYYFPAAVSSPSPHPQPYNTFTPNPGSHDHPHNVSSPHPPSTSPYPHAQQGPSSPPARYSTFPQQTPDDVSGPSSDNNLAAPPPSYADVIKGDHKIQTQD